MEPHPALAIRSSLYKENHNNAVRIIHGDRDRCPGIFVDNFAGCWLLQTLREKFPAFLLENAPEKTAFPPRSVYWKKLDKGEKGPPNWVYGERLEAPFDILENGMRFEIDFCNGYSQGLFLDQRDNRSKLRKLACGKRVLNTFAYTCSFSVAAALGGGTTCSIDIAKPCLEWGKRNFLANDLSLSEHEFICGEVFDWLHRFVKKGRRFELIVLDPPSFSRTKHGSTFQIERDFAALLELSLTVLSPGGKILCCTNLQSLPPKKFSYIISKVLQKHSAPYLVSSQPMPLDFRGDHTLKSVWVTQQMLMPDCTR